MMANYNQYVVNVQDQFGEEAVLMGAGLFPLQTKLTDEAAWSVIYRYYCES